MSPPRVFLSYSHRDEEWKHRLATQLKVLQYEGLLDVWDDRRIAAGSDWRSEIQHAIEDARVAVILISADFLTSDFITGQEVPRLLRRRATQGLIVLPVIIRPCPWQRIDWLASMQVRPRDGRPISQGTTYRREEDLAAIADEVARILKRDDPSSKKVAVPQAGKQFAIAIGGPGASSSQYICYIARERLDSLFFQLDEGALLRSGFQGDQAMDLSFGRPDVVPSDARQRRATVRRLGIVLAHLQQTARICDLASIVQSTGRLDCDWYDITMPLSASGWKPEDPAVYPGPRQSRVSSLLSDGP